MNLRTLKRVINIAIPLFDLNFNRVATPANQEQMLQITNLIKFREAIGILDNHKLFTTEINELKSSIIYTSSQDQMVVKSTEGTKVKALITSMSQTLKILNQSLDEIVGSPPENSVLIKLNNINDFKQLSDSAIAFDKILSQIILDEEIGGNIKIEKIEDGSVVLLVLVGSILAVKLIGSMVWSSAVIYKKIQEAKLVEQHVNALRIKNESLDDIKNAHKQELELLLKTEADYVYGQYFAKEDQEKLERMKNSIRILSEQLQKGAEVYPALNSPEEVKNLFPQMDQIMSIVSKIKQITAG